MADISNKALALLVLAALVVVVVGTTLQLSKLGEAGLVGFATSDSGTVSLNINESLNIEIDAGNSDIQFGDCTPWAGGVFWVDSNDSTANGNCSGAAATGLDNLTLNNIGNVDATVNVSAECNYDAWLPEENPTSPQNRYEIFISGCSNGNGLDSYTAINDTPDLVACDNMSTATSIHMWARVQLDTDTSAAQNCGGDEVNTMTFSAIAS